MEICKKCRCLFDPTIVVDLDDPHSKPFLCSWHPGERITTDFGDKELSYREEYFWTCCKKYVLQGISIDGKPIEPHDSPGCQLGHHVADLELQLSSTLTAQLEAAQKRLSELRSKDSSASEHAGVFVSYAHQDMSFVDWLCARLAMDRIDYFRDEKDILVGDVIDRCISDGIQEKALFLIVLSRASIISSWVQRELDEATHEVSRGKKVLLPLVLDIPLSDLPARIRQYSCANFAENRDVTYLKLRKSILAHQTRILKNAG